MWPYHRVRSRAHWGHMFCEVDHWPGNGFLIGSQAQAWFLPWGRGKECMQIKPWHIVDFSSDIFLAQVSFRKSLIYACVISTRGIKWSHPIWKCSQNLAFARIACKNYMSVHLLILAKVLESACMHTRIFVKISCHVAKHNLHLENKSTETGNNVSSMGNWETCVHHGCFWKNASSFCWRLLKLAGLSSVPGGRVTLPETFLFCL